MEMEMFKISEIKISKNKIWQPMLNQELKEEVNLVLLLELMVLILRLLENMAHLLDLVLLTKLMDGLMVGAKREIVMEITFLREKREDTEIDCRLEQKGLLKDMELVLLRVTIKDLS